MMHKQTPLLILLGTLLAGGALGGCGWSNKRPADTATAVTATEQAQTTVAQNMPKIAKETDIMLYVSKPQVGANQFLKMQMNSRVAYVAMADSVMPDKVTSTIALCVEAAFTGELLPKFESTNVAGDYVIDGRYRRGYACKANTGLLFANPNGEVKIATTKSISHYSGLAAKSDGCMFEQILLVENGKSVYTGTPIKPASVNIYRAACVMQDGNFAVIQSQESLPLKDFIASLIRLGVKDALYLDMGRGWNYGYYRQTMKDDATQLFDYRTPYQTNWLIIRAK